MLTVRGTPMAGDKPPRYIFLRPPSPLDSGPVSGYMACFTRSGKWRRDWVRLAGRRRFMGYLSA